MTLDGATKLISNFNTRARTHAQVYVWAHTTTLLCKGLGPVSRKSRKLSGPEKPFVKLRAAYSVKLVFSYVVKRIKIKITAKFRASRRLSFEDTKRIMSPEMRPESLGTFEKQAPDTIFCGFYAKEQVCAFCCANTPCFLSLKI